MRWTPFLAVVLLVCGALPSRAEKDLWSRSRDIRNLTAQGRFLEAQSLLETELEKEASEDQKEGLRYLRLWIAVQGGQYEQALQQSEEMLKAKPLMEEEIRSLRSVAFQQLNQKNEAVAEDLKLLDLSPNFFLRFDANMRIGKIRMNEGKLREARGIFQALEKKARGTPSHPDVMIELAKLEKKVGSSTAACQWFRRVYKRNPLHPLIKDWGPDLASNVVDGVRTGCANTREDFRDRVRALMWSGEEEKARTEVQEVATAMAREDRPGADEIRAWFLLQNGDPDEAYRLLQPNLAIRSHQSGFLMLLASAAARSGQGSVAVGAYHRLYELTARTPAGRKALYQSAFLSYQFQDYDGASRRFQEFIKKYPNSGLSRDARWNLAWISYLKGDYDFARKQFLQISSQKKSLTLRERARYWMAMSYLKQGKPEQARPLFASIATDKSGSYYGLAARQRLAKLPMPAIPQKIEDAGEVPRALGSARWGEFLKANSESVESGGGEETESEEQLVAENETEPSETTDDEEASTDLVQETGRSEISEEGLELNAPALSRRFERAKLLLRLGFNDDARWELFEIERKTRSKEDLRKLVMIYQDAEQWHRAASIALLRFSAQRVSQGMEGARPLWEAAYPQAFSPEVKNNAKKNEIPEEFIWGIMKAESQYRRDAVSPVGALGLMQIMPGTGRKLSELMKDKDFRVNELLQPELAIRYGSYYLKRLSSGFDSSIPLTAAAYNAGPHRVHSWLLSFGPLDMDEFVEHIPFLETREYVRKVVAGAMVYGQLYKGRTNLVDLASPVAVKGRPEFSKKESWGAH